MSKQQEVMTFMLLVDVQKAGTGGVTRKCCDVVRTVCAWSEDLTNTSYYDLAGTFTVRDENECTDTWN